MSSNQTQPEEGTALVENPSHTTKVAELQPEDEYYYSKLSLVILAQLSTFMYAGIIFGWSPLLAMFKQEGYYSDECSKSDDLCTAQTDSLETIYTIASVCAEVCAIFVGIFQDSAGLRSSVAMGCTNVCVGLYFMLCYNSPIMIPGLSLSTSLTLGAVILPCGSMGECDFCFSH